MLTSHILWTTADTHKCQCVQSGKQASNVSVFHVIIVLNVVSVFRSSVEWWEKKTSKDIVLLLQLKTF